MDEGAKRRLVGAAVLVALAVIFVPMLLDDKETDGLGEPIVIPDEPDFDAAYDTSVEPAEQDLTPPLPIPEPPPGATVDSDQATADMASPASARPIPEPVPEPVSEPGAASSGTRPERAAAPATAASAKPPAARPSAVGPKPVPPGTAAWVIQVASLGSPEAAQTLQNELRGKGYPAFVEQATVNGKLYYRVRVGPEVDRARADRTASKLQGETGTKPLVQSYR
jgi:DedD protein